MFTTANLTLIRSKRDIHEKKFHLPDEYHAQ